MTTTARPRAIIVSEIIQLVLLAEPLRRAFQTGFIVSVVGTVAITCVAGGGDFVGHPKEKDLGKGCACWTCRSQLAVSHRPHGMGTQTGDS